MVYDRPAGLIKELRDFGANEDQALEARFEWERQHHGDTATEVVVLGAESRKALEDTHARYFKSPAELLTGLMLSDTPATQ